METWTTAGVSSEAVPEAGATLSHDPPVAVAVVAVQFSVPPPLFPIVRDACAGFDTAFACTLIAEGDTVSCPGGAAVTVNCTLIVDEVAPDCTKTLPLYVPGASVGDPAVTEMVAGTYPAPVERLNQFPPDVVLGVA